MRARARSRRGGGDLTPAAEGFRSRRRRFTVAMLLAAGAGALAATAACRDAGGPIEMKVTKNGFEPANVHVAKGKPLELRITRTTAETCATEIVIPDAGVNVALPLDQPVTIRFTPPREGRLKFACAMGMFGGTIDVR